ncbi:hypothetical protein MFIFM68171_09537 [Madurella fahalii]|uniref:Rhodopsin domain-containing protein n=1 Tax=Madurella fahalii TaxID=1157608 RepID=A0ABQ0GNI8_9PEZI
MCQTFRSPPSFLQALSIIYIAQLGSPLAERHKKPPVPYPRLTLLSRRPLPVLPDNANIDSTMAELFDRSSHSDGSVSSGGIRATDTDQNPIIQMTTWLLLALTTLMFCFRLVTKFFLRSNKVLGVEEILAFSAFLFSVGQSVTVLVPEAKGLGKDIADISTEELRAMMQTTYAGDLLFILGLGFSKLSICVCLLTLSADRAHRCLIFVLGSIALFWALASCLGSALRCGTHMPWNSSPEQCLNLRAFLEFVGITNILTDAALVALPAIMIYPLNVPLKNRAIVLSFFGLRVLVIVPTVMQLVYLPRLFEDNYTLRAFPYYMCIQVVQFAAISTTCFVYFWPLLNSLRSGLMWADNMGATTSSFYYSMSKRSRSHGAGASRAMTESVDSGNPSRRTYIRITTGYRLSSSHMPNNDDHLLPPEPSWIGRAV